MIASTVMRCARRFRANTPELIDHLVQASLLKICAHRCRILSEFEPRSPNAISGFVKSVAFSVTLDYFRIGMTENRASGLSDPYAKGAVVNRHGVPETERETLLRQIDEHLATAADPATGARDRRIFWLPYRHGMTAHTIAAILASGLTQTVVEECDPTSNEPRPGAAGGARPRPPRPPGPRFPTGRGEIGAGRRKIFPWYVLGAEQLAVNI